MEHLFRQTLIYFFGLSIFCFFIFASLGGTRKFINFLENGCLVILTISLIVFLYQAGLYIFSIGKNKNVVAPLQFSGLIFVVTAAVYGASHFLTKVVSAATKLPLF